MIFSEDTDKVYTIDDMAQAWEEGFEAHLRCMLWDSSPFVKPYENPYKSGNNRINDYD